MTTNPPKTNDHNIGCNHFLLRLKAKELNVPNNSRKVTTSMMLTANNIKIAFHAERDRDYTPLALQVTHHKIDF